jgi:hypothetical protein
MILLLDARINTPLPKTIWGYPKKNLPIQSSLKKNWG